MNTWKQGIKEAFTQIYEEKAQQTDLDWMNDYNNVDKWNKSVEARQKYNSYKSN